jgi:hypothetical protein
MSQTIRNACLRSPFAATLAAVIVVVIGTAIIPGTAARAEQAVDVVEAPKAETKEVPFLEVLSFEQMTTLAPEARRQYMDGLAEMMVDLAITDQGTEYEYFGGTDLNASYSSLDGWRGGYYVLNRAFLNAAYAQTQTAPAPAAAAPAGPPWKERIMKQYEAERAAIVKDWTPTWTGTVRGTQYLSNGILRYTTAEWNKGQQDALEALKKRYLKDYSATFAGEDLKKQSPEVKPITGEEAKKIVEAQKEAAAKGKTWEKNSKGEDICPSPDLNCSKKRSKADIKKMAEARKGKCIYAGNVSKYEGSENAADRKPGRCKRPEAAKFPGLTVACDSADKKNVILCNPVLFDTAEVYKTGMKTMKGLCVPASATATVDCGLKSKAARANVEKEAKGDKSKLPKRFWENEQIPGIAEEVNKISREANSTCGDARIRDAQCRECATIQRNLAKTNVFAKNCKAVPLPPGRPAEFPRTQPGTSAPISN